MPDNAILKAYATRAIGNGTNGGDRQTVAYIRTVPEQEQIPVISTTQASQKQRPVIKVKSACAHAQTTGCQRSFAERACVKAVLAEKCKPPGSVRIKFVDDRTATPGRLLIASGCGTYKSD